MHDDYCVDDYSLETEKKIQFPSLSINEWMEEFYLF